MQVWIASLIILFALSQFLEWLRGVEFTLPMLALLGLLLSIVSNYDKRASLPFWPSPAMASGEAVLPSPATHPAGMVCDSAPAALAHGASPSIELTAPAIQSSQSIT